MIEKPDWYCKPIDIPELSLIQDEFRNIILDRISTTANSNFYYITRQDLEKENISNYLKMLERLGLLDKWKYSAVITDYGHPFPIHVDAEDWTTRCYALNIPILNCEDSYTVWYDAEIDPDPFTSDQRSSARLCIENTAKELYSHPVANPAWVNISIPHRPVTHHKKFRAVLSARFSPEIHDYFN